MRARKSIAILIASLLLLGAGCFGGSTVSIKPVTLEYWRADDAPETLAAVVAAYQKIHPNVAVNVRSFRGDEYEKKLLEALAENRGPDMFAIPNVKMREYRNRILPLPKETVIPTLAVDNKGDRSAINLTSATLSIRDLINAFVEQVPKDVVLPGLVATPDQQPQPTIYGLPYSLDTLALFVNEDLLRKASIEKPAESWAEFQNQATTLTALDPNENILQSGAAIGTGMNILHATELLSTIMTQNGATMADENGFAQFDRFTIDKPSGNYPPGVEAYIFYTSFAVKGSRNYCWNTSMPSSLDAFIAGKTAYFFGYPRDAQVIKTRAPKLNVTIVPMPQIDPAKPAYAAYYPVEVVSTKTRSPNEAWDFIQFAAGKDRVATYLSASRRPTALRSLIADQLTDPDLAPFASQVLTGRSWYKGADYDKAAAAFERMIETTPDPVHPEYSSIVSSGVNEVNRTIRSAQ